VLIPVISVVGSVNNAVETKLVVIIRHCKKLVTFAIVRHLSWLTVCEGKIAI
jgi:hypothetical protein